MYKNHGQFLFSTFFPLNYFNYNTSIFKFKNNRIIETLSTLEFYNINMLKICMKILCG